MTLQPDSAVHLPQGASATNSIVAGEPLPGILLDLRLDRTTFIAGGVIEPQIVIHNTTGFDANIDAGASAAAPGQPPTAGSRQSDPRWWPDLRGQHSPGGRRLASGESLTLSSIVQLPFDPTQPVELHATVRVGLPTMTPPGSGRLVDVDVPLQLTAPTPDQELTLELQTDRHQWCLQATTTGGAVPMEPLDVALTLHGSRLYGERAPLAEDGGVYAGRWGLEGEVSMANGVVVDRPADDPFMVSAWAGGPDYVTAVTQGAVPAGP
ncbi:MAG: hypothetical protein JOZ81_05405 [Chloroflexi bacterium]|nr:hypothetical protein [Chloroflexota bacterium]